MFTLCPSQNGIFSTVVSVCNHCSQWQGLNRVLKLTSLTIRQWWGHQIPTKGSGCHQIWAFSKVSETQILPVMLRTASLSILVSLERKRGTKDRAEFNMSKVSLKMAGGFWKSLTWYSHKLIVKMGTRQNIIWARLLVEPHSGDNTQNGRPVWPTTHLWACPKTCDVHVFFTGTLGCRVKRKRYKMLEWCHSGKDSLPTRYL